MYRAAEPKPVIRQMARQLGVHPEALRNWIRRDEGYQSERAAAVGRGVVRGAGAPVPELPAEVEAELGALRKGAAVNYPCAVGYCRCVLTEDASAEKFAVLKPHLDERQWRLLLGAEAEAIGRGGVAMVARASGSSRTTVRVGVREVRDGVVPDGRVRAPGAGRPPVEEAQPGIEEALEELVSPETRGDPCSPLRWTTKSLRQLGNGLAANGYRASTRTVSRLLRKELSRNNLYMS